MALVNLNRIRDVMTSINGITRHPLIVNTTRGLRGPNPGPKRTYEDRNRKVLNAHKDKHLALADFASRPAQFKLPKAPPEPRIMTKERKLLPLHEELPPYAEYPDKAGPPEINDYYDPLFNPHLHDGRYKVDPEEEPFSSIYVDSKSEEANEFTRVRNIATPDLWEYVERLKRIKTPPEPVRRRDGEPIRQLPSGIVPPPENPPNLPYHISRTRNYLLPVYYFLDDEPEKCYTTVKLITGDIWKLEEDLRGHLECLHNERSRILTSVQETDGRVLFRGRHLHEIVNWLYMKGF